MTMGPNMGLTTKDFSYFVRLLGPYDAFPTPPKTTASNAPTNFRALSARELRHFV